MVRFAIPHISDCSSRILDPILYDLLEPAIRRTPHTFKVQKRDLSGFLYERPFDQRLINHLLEVLLSVVSFAGQGFTKAAATSSIKRSHHALLVQRVEACQSSLDVCLTMTLIACRFPGCESQLS